MPMHKVFTASCDKCGVRFDGQSDYSYIVKEQMKKAGWVVNNKLTCPECRKVCVHCGAKHDKHLPASNAKKNKSRSWMVPLTEEKLPHPETDGEVIAVDVSEPTSHR